MKPSTAIAFEKWRRWAALIAVLYFACAQVLLGAHARSLDAAAPGHHAVCVFCLTSDGNNPTPAVAGPALPEPLALGAALFVAAKHAVEARVVLAAKPRGPPSY